MPNIPSVACVISNYNYRDYIGKAVESALNQTVPFSSITVVDDGSSDDSLEVLKQYADRIDVVSIENRGQTGACLFGMLRHEADYVYFLDADDYAMTNLVERVVQAIGDERPAKIQFQLVTVGADGRNLGVFPTFAEKYGAAEMVEDNRVIGFYRSPPTSGNVIHRPTLMGLEFSTLDPRGAIDGTLNLVLPYLGEIISLNEPLACRLVHDKSFGQWGNPTPDLFAKESRIFSKTWDEARQILKLDRNPFGEEVPVYLLERALFTEALEGKPFIVDKALKYIARLSVSRQPGRQIFLLSVFSVLLCVPIISWREKLILLLRSPGKRSGALSRILGFAIKRKVVTS